jgi:hypothetical protein
MTRTGREHREVIFEPSPEEPNPKDYPGPGREREPAPQREPSEAPERKREKVPAK